MRPNQDAEWAQAADHVCVLADGSSPCTEGLGVWNEAEPVWDVPGGYTKVMQRSCYV